MFKMGHGVLMCSSCFHQASLLVLQYSVDVNEFGSDDKRGVRLTLLKPRLEDSGHYICTASNQFETREATVHLSVWLPGIILTIYTCTCTHVHDVN